MNQNNITQLMAKIQHCKSKEESDTIMKCEKHTMWTPILWHP